jgi:O-antigen/teichoic acid export membrane protein
MKVGMQQTTLLLYRFMRQLRYQNLARASAWLFIGSIATGILGYVFQVTMGRMLTSEEYGLFNAMIALLVLLSTPLTTLMMVVARKVSEYRARQDAGSITHFYYFINIRTVIVGVLILCAYLFFASQIQFFLKVPSLILVYLLGALLLLTFLPVINNAFLQGLQSFIWISASGTLGALLKIFLAATLVWLGFGVAGALGGTILAVLAGWLITYVALHRRLMAGRGLPFLAEHLSIKPALPVLAANVAFTVMTQLDIVLVNYYFPAHEAGLYSAASILGKGVMYLGGGITTALFPMVAENYARDKSSAGLLLQAAGLTTLLCGIGAVFYFLFGEMIIALLYGESYDGAGNILKYYGFAIFPMALVMVAEHFLIAKRRILFAYLSLLIAPLQLTAIYFYHDTLQMVVAVVGGGGLLLALIGYGVLWQIFRKELRVSESHRDLLK